MIRVKKIEDRMLYYGYGTTVLEMKNSVVAVVFNFLKHNGLCGRLAD